MSVKSRTIDNLGVETSIRYAQDQALAPTTEQLWHDAKNVSSQAEVAVTQPISTEFEQLFGLKKQPRPFAFFSAPPAGDSINKLSLFSWDSAVPGLNIDFDFLQKPLAEAKRSKKNKPSRKDLLEEQEKERQEKERQILATFCHELKEINDLLEKANSLRNQFHKG